MLTYREKKYKTAEVLKWSQVKTLRPKVRGTIETIGVDITNTRLSNIEDLSPWFFENYDLSKLINEFWGLETQSRLLAVTRDIDDKAWHGLVSEWDSTTRQPGEFRLNKSLIDHLLGFSLGRKDGNFKLKELSQLEFALFENFFVELENFWKDYWKVGMPSAKGTYSYLIWVVDFDDKHFGSLAISIPPGVYPQAQAVKGTSDLYGLINEFDVQVPLDLLVGKTKLKISEVRDLESGDLLVFEKSNSSCLVWEKNEFDQLIINLELPDREDSRYQMYFLDQVEIETMNEENTTEDLLTDLPVEVTAQFKSVSMPIKKILELEQGDVLPLGLLMESPLTLMAPGEKPLAQGNLVIVGNQFGLRIAKTGLKNNKAPNAQLTQGGGQMAPAPAEPQYGQVPEAMDAGMQVADPMAAAQATQDPNLDQELQDMGIDPKELDELEDLY